MPRGLRLHAFLHWLGKPGYVSVEDDWECICLEMLNRFFEKAYATVPLEVMVNGQKVQQTFYLTTVLGSDAVLGMDWMINAGAGTEPGSLEIIFRSRSAHEFNTEEITQVDADEEFTLQVVPGWNFEETGVIRPSLLAWGFPIILAQKPDGS